MPDGSLRYDVTDPREQKLVTTEHGEKIKKELLDFCYRAEASLNKILELDGDTAISAKEKFKQEYALPLRMTVRAINNHDIPQEEFLSMTHEQAGSLSYFIEHRASNFSKSDSAEISIALNHIVGRFHEIGAM